MSTPAIPPAFAALGSDAVAAVYPRWPAPCEAVFELLADRYPADLARLVSSGRLEPHDLTFAAEAFGQISDGELVRKVLVPLLDSPSSVVREGVIYGLQRHLDEEARARVRTIARTDPSPALRVAAAGALEEHDGK